MVQWLRLHLPMQGVQVQSLVWELTITWNRSSIVTNSIKDCKNGLCCAVLSHSVVSNSLLPHGLEPARLLCQWGFSRQEYLSGLPCPSPGAVPNPGIEPRFTVLQADSLPFEPPGKPKNTRWVAYPFSRESSWSVIKPGSPALQVDSLPAELPAKP